MTTRRSSTRPLRGASAGPRAQDTIRNEAVRRIRSEIEAWRAVAMPDADAPLDVDDLTHLLRSFVDAMRLDPAIASGFTVNTIHYYRRKEIIDPPEGRTAAARYRLRHLWQIGGARLAGHLGLVTLAEAREAMRGVDPERLLGFLAARVADAQGRASVRASTPAITDARPLTRRAAPVTSESAPAASAVMIPLPGAAWCVVPASHPAHHSAEAAGELTRALAQALRNHRTSGE